MSTITQSPEKLEIFEIFNTVLSKRLPEMAETFATVASELCAEMMMQLITIALQNREKQLSAAQVKEVQAKVIEGFKAGR